MTFCGYVRICLCTIDKAKQCRPWRGVLILTESVHLFCFCFAFSKLTKTIKGLQVLSRNVPRTFLWAQTKTAYAVLCLCPGEDLNLHTRKY